jgi:hypothetical protein
LPGGWSILYELAHLDRAVFEKLLHQGVIHPKLHGRKQRTWWRDSKVNRRTRSREEPT